MNIATPIKNQERIVFLDILRGIAVLFIFIGNISYLSGWLYLSKETKQSLGYYLIDITIEYLQKVFVQGKFYSIFSILFGIGFVILFNKFQDSEKQFVSLYNKRMLGLLVIGLLHLSLLWNGDILTLYALLGFLLTLFRNFSNRNLLAWAVVLIFLPVLNWLLIYLTGIHYYRFLFQIHQSYLNSLSELPKDIFVPLFQIQTENLSDFFKINFGNFFRRFGYFLLEGRPFKVLGCFVLGIWIGRKILTEKLLENSTFLKSTAIYGFMIGIPFNIIIEYSGRQRGVDWAFLNLTSYSIGVVSLACAYSATVALLFNSKYKFLNLFGDVGRMALTNYLLQTVISIFLLYGIGLGLGTNLSLSLTMLILSIIFIFQILFSFLWLKKFKYGPIEWIWRIKTYGKLLAIRK